MGTDMNGREIAGWTSSEAGAKDRFYWGRILVALLLKLCEKIRRDVIKIKKKLLG